MLPNPLHPAIVHFPIVLSVLAPLVALVAWWAIRRGARPLRAWSVAAVTIAGVLGSGWLSKETGEDQEERVEDVVGERPLGTHEEAANLFLISAGVVLVLAGIGFAPGATGTVARGATVLGTLGVLAMGVRVGKSGGELVYEHGAASAYVQPGARGGEGRESAARGNVVPAGEARPDSTPRARDKDDDSASGG